MQIKYRNTKTNTKSTTLKTNLFFHPRQQQQKRQNRIPQYNHYKNNGPSSSFLINVIFCISTTIFSIGILLLYVFYTSSPRRSDWNDNRNNVEMIVNRYKDQQQNYNRFERNRLGGMHHVSNQNVKEKHEVKEEYNVLPPEPEEKEEKQEEEGEEINIKDFLYLTTSLTDDYWGNSNTSPASSYAELPYCIECYPTTQTSKIILSDPFILSVWVYLLPVSSQEYRIIVTSNNMELSIKTTLEGGNVFRYIALEYSNRNHPLKDEQGNFISNYYTTTTSNHESIPLERWIHVGLVVQSNDNDTNKININLYLNGKLVLESNTYLNQKIKTFQTGIKTRIGQSFSNTNGLEGYIAMLSLWMGTTSPTSQRTQYFSSFMRAVYRTGLYQNEIISLSTSGLAKSPSLLYTFNITAMDKEGIKSPLAEEIRKLGGGYIYKGIQYFENKGGFRYLEYKNGTNTMKQKHKSNVAHVRSIHIREAAKTTIGAYIKYALGQDELLPLSKVGHNNWDNLGLTLLESLDTLILLKLHHEFELLSQWLTSHPPFQKKNVILNVSQSCIRILGSLLSTYELTKNTMFLKLAEQLSNILLKAFITSTTGLPYTYTTLDLNGRSFYGQQVNVVQLSDLGIYALEFRYLAKLLSKPIYAKSVLKVYEVISSVDGLLPSFIQTNKNMLGTEQAFSLNGGNVFYYTTLLRMYIQGGRVEHNYWRMYDKATKGIIDNLVSKNSEGLVFIAQKRNGRLEYVMDESVCSFAGTLVLGAYTNPYGFENKDAQRDLQIGKALAYTCYQMYARTKSGLAPESVTFHLESKSSMTPNNKAFKLNSSFVESLFILFALTKDPTYQEWGWEIFVSIERYCRAGVAYATLADVDQGKMVDELDGRFLARTLKYLYLLFEGDGYNFDIMKQHVFSAGGHVLKALSDVEEMKWGY